MKTRNWLLSLLAILSVMLLVMNTGLTRSFFTDIQQSTNDALGIKWGLYTLNDGFEGTPWDNYWNENGTTTFVQDSGKKHAGTYSALSDSANKGYLTTDEINASAADNITISFWFYPKNLNAGDVLVQSYNGTAYNTWYDITNYPTYSSGSWNLFNETITDAQYRIAGFRLRFDSSGLALSRYFHVDDVNISTDSIPPATPTGLAATAGDTKINLNWNDNGDSDLWGYNVYRSSVSGGPYTKVNPEPVLTSNYTDTGLTNGTPYYYVVTAVDYGGNESTYSGESNASPLDLAPEVPAGLAANAGNESISLSWDANTDYDLAGYNIYRSATSNGTYTKLNGSLVTATNYTNSGLYGGGTYYYVITAVDLTANESSYSSEASATAADVAPAPPTGLLATPGDKQAILSWNANNETDIDGYNVYRSTVSGGAYTKVNGSLVITTNFTDTGLVGGVTYYFVITAVDLGSNESGYSAEASATPTDPAPAAPTGLTATPGDKQVSLDWNNNSEPDFAGYNVYRSTTSGGPYSKVNGSLVLTSNYTNTGLSGNVTYYFVVTAVDLATNESGYSSQADATPTDPAPAAPAGLTATPGDKQVTLDWSNNSESDLAGYNVYRSLTSSSNYTKINGTLVSTSNYTDTGLSGNVTYYFVVTAVDLADHESVYSSEDSATPTDPPPAAPTGLVATPGDMQISLDWDNNGESDLAGYNVYRSLTSSSNYTKINGTLVSTSNYTDTGLSVGVTYYYVVTAVDSADYESGYSSEVNGAPPDLPPSAPTSLNATAGDTKVVLDWNDNSELDLSGYNVYRSLISGANYTKINTGLVSTSNYTDTGRTNGVTYYYVVTAVDLGSNESSYSSQASATPVDLAPDAPTGLIATAGNEQITLDWNDNTDYDLAGYNVYRSTTDNGTYTKINGSQVSTSNYSDSGLYGGGTYYYKVTAVDLTAHESGYSNGANATAVDVAPAAPTGLTATPGDKQVTLDWNDNTEPDMSGYNVYRSTISGGPYSKVNGSLVTTSNYTNTGLSSNVTYYFVVTAVDLGSNESGYSSQADATPTDPPPAAPTGLNATAGDKQVSLTWNANNETDLDGYNVYRGTTSGGPYSKVNGSLVTSANYTNTGLSGNVTYYFVVTAVDLGNNESSYSNQANATPTDPPPAAPAGLTATRGVGLVDLIWNANNETDLGGYNVYRSTTSGSGYSKINGSLVTSANYTDSSVTNGIRYYYVVTAVDLGNNESGYSNEANARPIGPPQTLLTDGFEGTPWDNNWNDNGATNWARATAQKYAGTYSAGHSSGQAYLTSDNINTFAAENITVTFWFYMTALNKGPLYIQTYNGTAYNNWYNLTTYPGVVKNTWINFNVTITDTQYFRNDFRIRFDGSTLTTTAYVDDVQVSINQ